MIATTFVAALVGVAFSLVQPNSYQFSTSIQTGDQSVFLKYTSINALLKKEGLLFDGETNPNGYRIDSDSIFEQFVVEFNDYEEMVDALSSSEYVQEAIKNLDEIDKQGVLIAFAKSFELKAPTKNAENWHLSFEWHDNLEGVRLFDDAILKTLVNIRNVAKENIDDLATAVDIRNSRELESLHNEMSLIENKQMGRDKKRIQYLIEQSAIAKELGIERNKLDPNGLTQSSENGISLSFNSIDVPYYLRGYKAIDKEIELIRNRTQEQMLLSADKYLELKKKVVSLENDLASSQLRDASKTIEIDNPNDWVEFDMALADSKSQRKSKLYVALSIVSGGMIGVLFVLVSNAVRKRRERLAKA
ncbi:MAG: hypothetical protein CMM71_08445 [Rhodospirillaceae bacterium]|nr:hypothetical protein [Rhodospirillaceae bacterium]